MQDWPTGKWLFWVNFFSSKVPEFLHTLFNLVVKHSLYFLPNLLKGKAKNANKIPFVLRHYVHCSHFYILSSYFSETKCKPAKKKYKGMFCYLRLNSKAHAKIWALLKEKKFTQKSHFWGQSLHKAIQFLNLVEYWVFCFCLLQSHLDIYLFFAKVMRDYWLKNWTFSSKPIMEYSFF